MEKDWSKLAENFDDLQRYITGEPTDTIIKESLSNLKNAGDLIEFGCGIGNYTKTLAKLSNSILATDISSEMVRVAKEKLKDFSNVQVQEANCYGTDFEDKTYDTVFMANLIHVVQDPQKALAEAHRLLKNGGKLVIITFTPEKMSFGAKIKMTARYLKAFGVPPKGSTPFTVKTLTEFAAKNNFKIESAELLGNKQSKAVFIVAKKI